MKKLLIILSFIICATKSFSQIPFVPRSSPVLVAQDARLRGQLNFYYPHTRGLTLNGGPDTLGAVIYDDSSGHVWFRDTIPSGGHKWSMSLKTGDAGSTNSNIGSGYRWVIPNTNNIKTLFPGYGQSIDSSSNANGLTIKSDTGTLFPAIRATIPAGSGNPNSNVGSGFRWALPGTNNIKTFFAGYGNLLDSSSNSNGITIKNDTATLFPAIRATIPAGSGNTNSNIGSGYRWAIPGTNNIKTYFNGYGLLSDSTTNTNGLTIKVDTGTIFPVIRNTLTTVTTPGTCTNCIVTFDAKGRAITFSNGGKSSLFADSNARIAGGVIRPSASLGHGNPTLLDFLGPIDGHDRYIFSPYIEGTSGGFIMFYQTMSRIINVMVNDDEALAGNGVMAGASVQLDQALVSVWAPANNFGGYLVGNGTATLDQSNMGAGWTISYVPTSGAIFMNTNVTLPNYLPIAAVYQGVNNYHIKRIVSGLGIYNIGFQILDGGNNPVTDTLASTDIITITGQSGSSYAAVRGDVNSGINETLYAGTFSNFWVGGIFSIDPADPSPTTGFTATAISSSRIDVSWTATPGATNYVVTRGTAANARRVTSVFSGSGTSFSDTGLTTGTTYYYVIQATNTAGAKNNGYSAIAQATTL